MKQPPLDHYTWTDPTQRFYKFFPPTEFGLGGFSDKRDLDQRDSSVQQGLTFLNIMKNNKT